MADVSMILSPEAPEGVALLGKRSAARQETQLGCKRPKGEALAEGEVATEAMPAHPAPQAPAAAAPTSCAAAEPAAAAAVRQLPQAQPPPLVDVGVAAAAAEALRSQLQEALLQFQEQRAARQLFLEVDVAAALGPAALTGRQLRVLWPDDQAWYLGTVRRYNDSTGEHTIDYADGDIEETVLALERVRLLMHAGERLPPPPAPELASYADLLAERAERPAHKQQAAALRQRAADLQQLSRRLLQEQQQPQGVGEQKQQQQQQMVADQQEEQREQGGNPQANECGIGQQWQPEQESVLEFSEAQQQQAQQRQQEHRQGGQQQLQEQQVVQQQRAEREHDQRQGVCQQQEQDQQQEQKQQQDHGLEQGVERDWQLQLKQDQVQQMQGAEQQQQQQQQPPASSGHGGGQHAPQAHQQKQQQLLLPGEVGWFKVAGYPHWPFMVVTREEAIAQGVSAVRLKNPAFLAVQYFGSGEVGAINPAAVDRQNKKVACFAAFPEGLQLGYHAPAKCNKMKLFRSCLYEVVTYLKEGELPPFMLPKHNDGLGADDDEDEGEVAPAKPAAKRQKSKAAKSTTQQQQAATATDGGPIRLPMRINQSLTVLSLGEVEWLHPAFHNEKYIFPVGFAAERVTATPASGRESVPHLMEVLRAADGSGPFFRVTPQGRPAVEGSTATKAWQALYASDEAGKARSLGISGDQMLGLTSPKLQRAIEALPGTHRCDRYCAWPDGQQPEAPPLSGKEQRERLACEARMQHLPDGVHAVPVQPSATGVCHVCNEEEEDEDDLIVQCNKCRVFVHMTCYGVRQAPNGNLWLCDACSLGLQRPPPCMLCPVLGGALKRTTCGRWAHPTCAMWLPETSMDAQAAHLHLRGLVQGVQQVHRTRFQLTCQLCQQQHGACTQCCEPRCYAGFHPLCARQAGYTMELVVESDCESEEDESDEQQQQQQQQGHPLQQQQQQQGNPLQQQQQQQGNPLQQQHEQGGQDRHEQDEQQQQEGGREGSCDENDAAAPNGSSKGVGTDQQGGGGGGSGVGVAGGGGGDATGGGKQQQQRRRQKRQEGTQAGIGIRLLAYCPKHGPAGKAAAPLLPPLPGAGGGAAATAAAGVSLSSLPASSTGQQQRQQQLSRQQSVGDGGDGAACLPAAAAAAVSGSSRQQQGQRELPWQAATAAAAAAAGAGAGEAGQPPPLPPHPWGAARALPFNHLARRGARAPEALAAAEAKRGFVRSLPYLVCGPQRQLGLGNPSISRRVPQVPHVVRWHGQEDEREEEQQQQQGQPVAMQGEGQHQQQKPPLGQQQQEPDHHHQQQQQQQASPQDAQQRRRQQQQQAPDLEQQPSSPAAGQARLLTSPSRSVKSDTDRFREMVATLGHRVTIGKSGIHGWGAFAKRRHAAHDMMIEYVGQLVRPSVSDLRERRMYDALVGAGTYVFRLNRGMCVDATRAGNLAHMLNHSCHPNCYSRTISITEEAGVVDHVVIFARRDVEVGEELTYDYRFCGEEQLPCNCGAAACRGRVNEKPPDWDELWVPRRLLKQYRPPRQ